MTARNTAVTCLGCAEPEGSPCEPWCPVVTGERPEDDEAAGEPDGPVAPVIDMTARGKTT